MKRSASSRARPASRSTGSMPPARRSRVAIDPLRGILAALGLPCASEADIAESRARLRAGERAMQATFVTATVGEPIALAGLPIDQRHAGRAVARGRRHEGDHGPRDARRGGRAADARARLSSPAPRGPRDHARGRAAALRDARRRRAGREAVGPCGPALLRCARPDDDGIRRHRRARRPGRRARRGEGADAIALSPTHSLFAADPSHFGPYSPSSRLFLNPLFADPALVFGAARVAAARGDRQTAERRRADRLAGGGARKIRVAAPAVRRFRREIARRRWRRISQSFVRDGGDRLREHALFEALHQHWFGAPEPKWNWSDWPADWRDPHGAGARALRRSRTPTRSEFHMFLQWLAARSFARVQQRRARRRHAHRPDRRSRGRHEPGRQPCLVAPAGPAARPERRRAARPVQHARAGLGPDRLLAAGADRERLRAVHRDVARRDAPCRRRAHRSRHGPGAALAVPQGASADGRRLSRLSGRRPAAPARARVASPSRHRDRRGPRHGRAGVPRAARQGRHRRHGRALVPARGRSRSSRRPGGAATRSR